MTLKAKDVKSFDNIVGKSIDISLISNFITKKEFKNKILQNFE
jgi:hypothetical protein